jgi:hypothetical protein
MYLAYDAEMGMSVSCVLYKMLYWLTNYRPCATGVQSLVPCVHPWRFCSRLVISCTCVTVEVTSLRLSLVFLVSSPQFLYPEWGGLIERMVGLG